jgi:3-isopropylmalate/(R)-2-methylmalate dehydratase large subunit
MTIVCGDSHTSTHGAFGNIAFGIGTSEVEMVMTTQCLLQSKPLLMRIHIDGILNKGVVSKDIVLYVLAQISASGATGYAVEFAGSAVRSLSMEARMTICNMSIEMGARCGMIAPDDTTFDYIKGRKFAPQGDAWDKALAYWKTLYSDSDAIFDKEIFIKAEDIEPMITYGTNPGMGIGISGHVPELNEIDEKEKVSFEKSLKYMGLDAGTHIKGKKVDYVFIGSCTNSRIEDLRMVASFVKGKQKAKDVEVWIVPGSKQVEAQAKMEGIDKIFEEAGFILRQPGCSACLGMKGAGARTMLASPLTAAAAAITGRITDVRELLN